MPDDSIAEIDRWLAATALSDSRLGVLACDNARAMERIRNGSARIDTLRQVLAYIRQNPALKGTPPSGRAVVAHASAMPETLDLGGAKVFGKDSLARACETAAVDKTPRAGTLLFYVSLPKDTVVQGDTVLELALIDIYDARTSFRQRVADWFSPDRKPPVVTTSTTRH